MNRLTKLLTATAAGAILALGAAQAQAAIFIGVQTGGTVTQIFTQADGPIDFDFAGGGFDAINIDGDGNPFLPGLLHTETVNLNNAGDGAASITFYVTRTGLTTPVKSFTSTFTSNRLNGPFNVTLETYVDTANGVFSGNGTGSLLASQNYPTGFGSNEYTTGFNVGGGPYSVTTKYVVTGTGRGSVSPDITISGAIPEPGTWALMILGFGGAGAMVRRRRAAFA
jgi:hypothetical protein